MPEDPFPQATQEFQPAWVEEDDDVAWETPSRWSREPRPAPPPPPRRPRAAARRPVPPRGPRATLQHAALQRPPPGRRRRAARPPGRRILAVLALALIGGALWLINATFQPFHDDPTGAVVVTVPTGSDAGEIGKMLESAGVIDSARLFEANATVTMRRGKLRPGKYQLPTGMTQRRRDRGADAGPEGEGGQDLQVHAPRGPLAAGERPARQEGRSRATTARRPPTRALPAPRAQARAAARSARSLEGFLFPATYQMISGASASDLVEAPARRLPSRTSPRSTMKTARKTQPDALRRADHRLDGRARGAARQGAPADRRGHLQPPARRASRSASTPPSATRSTTGRGRCASPSSSATRRTTRARAAACRRRRSATRASPRSRRPPTPRRPSTCSSCASPASPASTRSRRPTPSSSATSRATRPPAAVRDLPRRLRVAGGPLALAGDAQRGAARRGPRRLGVPRAAAAAGAVRRDRAGAARRGLPRRQRDDPAQGGRARARRRREPRRAGDRRRQHAHVRADGAIVADNTDAPGLLEALRGAHRPGRAQRARARRGRRARAPRCGRSCGAGAHVEVWNRTPARAAALADDARRAPRRGPGPPRSSSTRPVVGP